MNRLARYWKAIGAALGMIVTLIISLQPVLGDHVPAWVPVLTGALTVVAVWWVKNDPFVDPPAV
jgi:hypothetical protein